MAKKERQRRYIEKGMDIPISDIREPKQLFFTALEERTLLQSVREMIQPKLVG